MRSYFTHVAALPAILELLLNFSEKAISGFEPTHSVQNALRPKKSPVIGTNLQFLIYKMSISLYLVKKIHFRKRKKEEILSKGGNGDLCTLRFMAISLNFFSFHSTKFNIAHNFTI